MNIHSSDRMHGYQYCNCTLVAKKTDMYISHFSSSESDAITRKKEEECQTKQFELTLLKEERRDDMQKN